MKTGKKFFLPALLMMFSYLSGFSQEYSKGYIFGYGGDTISGYLETPLLNRAVVYCFFKPTMKDAPTAMTAKDIKGFGYDKTVYVSTPLRLLKTDTLVFTRLVFDDLYDLMYFEAASVKQFLIRRPDSTIFGIQYPPVLTASELLTGLTADKKFKLQTDSIFPDAPDLPEYQKGVRPDIISLNNLFRQYHNKPSSSMSRRIPSPAMPQDYKEGFVINLTGDTIDGFIANDFRKAIINSCIFSPGRNDNSVRFLPDDITGFGSRKENKIFVSATFPVAGKDTTVFVRLLLDGSIDLLYYESYGLKNFLFRDSQDKVSVLTYPPALTKKDYLSGLNSSKKFRITTDSILSALNIPGSQKPVKPELNSILNLLEEYHSSNSQVYKRYNGTECNLWIGPVAGVRFEKYSPEIKNNGFKSSSDPSPYAGVYLRLTNKKTHTGVVLRNTVSYHNDIYSYKTDFTGHSVYYQTTIKSLANSFDAGLTFNPVKKILPTGFIEAGPAIRYYINPDYENLINDVFTESNVVMSYINHEVSNSQFYYGGFIRAGISRAAEKNNLSISGGYNYLKGKGSVTVSSFDLSAVYTIRIR
ncbi:MAG TPA: hypothetical protein VK207_04685 [Bacteroidales bacterium]|nr:hypothetical protein [Bacteroidales bacterium]